MDTLLATFQGDPVKVVGYADDILLMVTGPDKGTLIDIMNEALERVLTWGDRNGLTFSPLKTCAVLFTRKATRGTRHNRKLLMDGTEVLLSDSMKYTMPS